MASLLNCSLTSNSVSQTILSNSDDIPSLELIIKADAGFEFILGTSVDNFTYTPDPSHINKIAGVDFEDFIEDDEVFIKAIIDIVDSYTISADENLTIDIGGRAVEIVVLKNYLAGLVFNIDGYGVDYSDLSEKPIPNVGFHSQFIGNKFNFRNRKGSFIKLSNSQSVDFTADIVLNELDWDGDVNETINVIVPAEEPPGIGGVFTTNSQTGVVLSKFQSPTGGWQGSMVLLEDAQIDPALWSEYQYGGSLYTEYIQQSNNSGSAGQLSVPTIDQLQLMYQQRDTLEAAEGFTAFLDEVYWSSTNGNSITFADEGYLAEVFEDDGTGLGRARLIFSFKTETTSVNQQIADKDLLAFRGFQDIVPGTSLDVADITFYASSRTLGLNESYFGAYTSAPVLEGIGGSDSQPFSLNLISVTTQESNQGVSSTTRYNYKLRYEAPEFGYDQPFNQELSYADNISYMEDQNNAIGGASYVGIVSGTITAYEETGRGVSYVIDDIDFGLDQFNLGSTNIIPADGINSDNTKVAIIKGTPGASFSISLQETSVVENVISRSLLPTNSFFGGLIPDMPRGVVVIPASGEYKFKLPNVSSYSGSGYKEFELTVNALGRTTIGLSNRFTKSFTTSPNQLGSTFVTTINQYAKVGISIAAVKHSGSTYVSSYDVSDITSVGILGSAKTGIALSNVISNNLPTANSDTQEFEIRITKSGTFSIADDYTFDSSSFVPTIENNGDIVVFSDLAADIGNGPSDGTNDNDYANITGRITYEKFGKYTQTYTVDLTKIFKHE